MKIFAIGMECNEGGGHGDPGGRFRAVRPTGAYGSGGYPPCFTTPEAAEQWITDQNRWKGTYTVIELELVEQS